MVLHDINQAIRFYHLITMKAGDIVATGQTDEVLTKDILGYLILMVF